MPDTPMIAIEDMLTEAELFRAVYPSLIGEIDRIEASRGKLNDFQLMMAVTYAKDGLGVLSYERRQIMSAIFEAFADRYRKEGRDAANRWAGDTFGCSAAADSAPELLNAHERLEELSSRIQEKEAELLNLYREYYVLERHAAQAPK